MKEVSVYTIVGMGGLGKTTLAQLVTNDERTKHHFEHTIWVYVPLDFSVKSVMKLIIQYFSDKMFEGSSLDSLQRKVREVLSGKRYLLVLDDVWSEDREVWDKLKCALSSGLPGSRILVTTRSEKITSVVRTHHNYRLPVLSEDDCWSLFRQRAFGPDSKECPELVSIGKEIVKKCGGIPLAAKALGGLMHSKMGTKEWLNIKESDLWDLSQGEVSILPSLRLSYYNFPLEMRRCFSYCAVFPKGSRMKKDKLIHLWMAANGFISSRGRYEVEDVGNEVWNELYKRSLFLSDEKKQEEMFVHDLVHDLARSTIGDECYTIEADSSGIIPKKKIRHATLVSNGRRTSAFPKALTNHNKLHSIILQDRGHYIERDSKCEFSCNFKKFCSLRVFDANGAKMMHLSGTIGNSRHLTYLNLSGTQIKELPASISSLNHLQTLNLDDCEKLERLPKKMHRIKSLRHLYLRRCYKIEATPPKLGKLTQLKTLSLFVVGESSGQHLDELQHLNLGGELKLGHLERVRNSMEAKEANLVRKGNLRFLEMKWRYSKEEKPDMVERKKVMDALEPHPNIKELSIWRYRGKEMPIWMSDPSVLKNVVSITINNCRNCLGLPALWKLPCLKRLSVDSIWLGSMRKMEYLFRNGNNNLSGGSVVTTSTRAFHSLEEIKIRSLRNMKGLLSMEEDEEGRVQQQLFPRLRKMKISNCPKLALLPTLPAIDELEIFNSNSVTLLASISKLTTLTSLRLFLNKDMVNFPEEMLQNLTLLQSLEITEFKSLKVLPENMSSLSSLKKLEIDSCVELECLSDGGIGSLQSLLEMTIYECPKIVSLPDSIQTLTQLQTLNIWWCSQELKMRCEKGKGPEWYKIKHIPRVSIS